MPKLEEDPERRGRMKKADRHSREEINLKTAVKPQRAQRTGRKAKINSTYRIHLLGDYSMFPFPVKYNDVFSVSSVVNAFFRINDCPLTELRIAKRTV